MSADPAVTQGLIHGIPDIFWTSIVGAGIALIGTLGAVIATNWGNTKRLRLQLQHDTMEKAKERLATLRRELYLKAADANIRGLAYFGTLPQADLTKPDADAPLRNVFAVGAQLQLVVRQETALLISDLICAYGELQLRLVAKVLPIHSARSNINICNEHYDNLQVEIKRVLAEMVSHNESGQHDRARFDQLNRSFEFTSGRSKRLAEERSSHWDQMNELQRQYLKDLLPEVKRIGQMQIQVLVELRRELDIGGDIDVFQEMMRKQMERVERAVDEFDRAVFGFDSRPDAQGQPRTAV